MPLSLKEIILYPIKSLGGVSVSEAVVEPRGLQHDRRYMLVTPDSGTFITQRTNHHMALIEVAMNVPANELRVWHRHVPDDVLILSLIPQLAGKELVSVSIWDSDDVPAQPVSAEADAWFSRVLGKPCRLVYMPDDTRRTITSRHTKPAGMADPVVSFADGFPMLLATQASLDELNRRVGKANQKQTDEPMVMARFRPNLIVEGLCWPHDEDTWGTFSLGDTVFFGVKPCVRCVLTTLDPATGERGKEPLQTLATYRRHDSKILFGENVMPDQRGVGQVLRVGDVVQIIERKEPWLPVGV